MRRGFRVGCERDEGERGNGFVASWGVSGREEKVREGLQAGRQVTPATAWSPRTCACPCLGKTTEARWAWAVGR